MDKEFGSININSVKLEGQEATLKILESNSDLSFRFLNNFEITNKEIIQSKLDGSIIKNCRFKDTSLSRSDLNAVRVENSSFFNVDFSSTDITSSVFSNCDFIKCNFNDAHISDCDFVHCKFEYSSFTFCSFLKSTVKNVFFKETLFDNSTNLLNKYYNTSFSNMSLGNCTFEYHIMMNCTFQSLTLNTDSLAYLYGCTMKQLGNVNLLFLGKDYGSQHEINTSFINNLFDGFINKHWFLGAFLLKMNFKLMSVYNCLNLIIELFIKQNELGFLMKTDELQFLTNIFHELNANRELPTLVLENYISKIGEMKDDNLEKNRQLFLNLKNTVIQLKNIQEEGLNNLFNFFELNQQIRGEFVFQEKPNISPEQLFSDINDCYSVNIKIFEIREGSFIVEIICGTAVLIKVLDLIKKLTGNSLEIYKNGVVLTELIKNREFRKGYKKQILNETIKEENLIETKEVAIKNINNSITTTSAIDWFPYMINETDSGGYGRNNLYKVNIKTN